MELWDAYDGQGNRTGQLLKRGDPLPEGVYHMVSEVIVRHEDGDFLLMQRSYEKEIYPGEWEIGAGGSVLAGESAFEGACRELWEETGIETHNLQKIYYHVDEQKHAIYHGYLLVTSWQKDAIRLQERETIGYRWLSKDDFLKFHDTELVGTQKGRAMEYVNTVRQEMI